MADSIDTLFKKLFAGLEKEIAAIKDDRQGLPAAVRPQFGVFLARMRNALAVAGRAYDEYNRATDLDDREKKK